MRSPPRRRTQLHSGSTALVERLVRTRLSAAASTTTNDAKRGDRQPRRLRRDLDEDRAKTGNTDTEAGKYCQGGKCASLHRPGSSRHASGNRRLCRQWENARGRLRRRLHPLYDKRQPTTSPPCSPTPNEKLVNVVSVATNPRILQQNKSSVVIPTGRRRPRSESDPR